MSLILATHSDSKLILNRNHWTDIWKEFYLDDDLTTHGTIHVLQL